MTQDLTRLSDGLTRRTALKTGGAILSGLAFGGTVSGTVAAQTATARAVPLHIAVRAQEDAEPSPKPDPQDLLVERLAGNPVDDGTDAENVDGSHQLRWGEYSALNGVAKIECLDGGGTEVTIEVAGVVPGGLYTIWVVEVEGPLDPEERDIRKVEEKIVGSAPLGANDGSENVFRATGGVGTIEAVDESEPYTIPPGNEKKSPSCLLDADPGHTIALIGALHLDDTTWGSVPFVTPGTTANQFAFIL